MSETSCKTHIEYPYGWHMEGYSYEPPNPIMEYCVEPTIGFSLPRALLNLEGPSLEIGGPTRTGYHFLNGADWLPAPLLISNLHTKQPKVDLNELDLMADGKQLPIKSSSIGVALASGITIVPEEIARNPKIADEKTTVAMQEYEDYKDEAVNYNQHIKIIEEVARTLRRGGLFITFTHFSQDKDIAADNELELKHTLTAAVKLPAEEPFMYFAYAFQKR